MHETRDDTTTHDVDDRALRHAYAAYLCAFAVPSFTPERLVRWMQPWLVARYSSGAEPVDEAAVDAALQALGRDTSLVLPADIKFEVHPPRPEHIAAVRLASEPHGDDDAPLSFNRFVEQLRAVMAQPAT